MWCWTSLVFLLVIYVSSLMKWLFKPLPILGGLICFCCCCWVVGIISIFWIVNSYHICIWFANILSYYVSCLFFFLILSFDEQTFSILINSKIHQNEFFKWWIWCIYFFVCFSCFWYLRSYWWNQGHKDLPICFLLRFLWFTSCI